MPHAPNPILNHTVGIVAAYAAKNHLPASALPDLITTIRGALCGLAAPSRALSPITRFTSAEIHASIRPDAIVSFEDGRPYKALRRHLTHLGITPEAYRATWGLPANYPLVAPSYAVRRAEIAREIGLGPLGGMARRAKSTSA